MQRVKRSVEVTLRSAGSAFASHVCVTVRCSALQCVAVCCVAQRVAVCNFEYEVYRRKVGGSGRAKKQCIIHLNK